MERLTSVVQGDADALPDRDAVAWETHHVLRVHDAVGVSEEVADAVEEGQSIPRSASEEHRKVDAAVVVVELRCVVQPLEDVPFPGDERVAAWHPIKERHLEEGLQDGDDRAKRVPSGPLESPCFAELVEHLGGKMGEDVERRALSFQGILCDDSWRKRATDRAGDVFSEDGIPVPARGAGAFPDRGLLGDGRQGSRAGGLRPV